MISPTSHPLPAASRCPSGPLRPALIGIGLATVALIVVSPRSAAAEEPADRGGYSDALIEKARQSASANPGDLESQVALARYLARKLNDSDEPALRREADQTLDRVLSTRADHPEALAWKGLLVCIQARNQESQALGRKGLDQLETALSMDPGNLAVKFLCAAVSIEAPKRWGHFDTGSKRMHQVEKALARQPELADRFDLSMATVHFKLGKIYQERQDYDTAVSHWNRAIEVGGRYSRTGRKAIRLVERYGGPELNGPVWNPGGRP